jgi:hypothetical protein
MVKSVIMVGQMKEEDTTPTETWIFPKPHREKSNRPVFDADIPFTEDPTYLAKSRLLAGRRRYQRVFGLTARYSTARQH